MQDLDPSHRACCRLPAEAAVCPRCGQKGRRVGAVTLDRHLAASIRARFGPSAGFCANPSCALVYFDEKAVVLAGETLLPVTQKDPGDDVLLCYCFELHRGDLRRDLRSKGSTDIPDRIQQGIEEGRCDCGRKNPQGACCLGNVAAAVQQIKQEEANRAPAKG